MVLNKYLSLGFILVLSTFNIAIGFVLFSLYITVTFRFTTTPRFKLIAIALCFKCFLILLINYVYSEKSLFYLLQTLSTDVFFLLILFLRFDAGDVKKFIRPLIALFFLDLAFNLSLIIFGVDPLGRVSGYRPDDFLLRLHGVFKSPMFTVAIATSGVFVGLFLQKRWLVALGFFAILINGTLRAPLTAILIVSFYVLLKLRVRFGLLVLCFFGFAGLVVLATVISASQSGVLLYGGDGVILSDGSFFISGNELRVFAWTSAIEQILDSPWIGNHHFSQGEFIMSADAILDFGIAEAPWLQLALDYGVIVPILDFLVLFTLVKSNIQRCYQDRSSNFNFTVALFSIVMFTERFYGVLYGTYFLTPMFLLCCVSAIEPKLRRA